MFDSEKLKVILEPERGDDLTSEDVYEMYNKLLELAQIHRDSNIRDSIQRIVSAYFVLLDYPEFLNTSKSGMKILQNLETLMMGKRSVYGKQLEKFNASYLK